MWLYKEIPVNALLVLANGGELYPSIVSKKSGVSYGYTIKLVRKMEGYGLLTMTQKDRRTLLSLTDKGKQLAEKMKLLLEGLK